MTESQEPLSPYHDDIGTPEQKLGRKIYHKSLAGRRGFRNDQLGIPSYDDIWLEIFEAIGESAILENRLSEYDANETQGIREMVGQMKTTMLPDKQRIVCAACLADDGTIFTGIRHYSPDMVLMIQLAGYSGRVMGEQGFVDQWGNFLNRQDAFHIALRNGQYRPYPPYNIGTLYSEDLY